SAATPCCASSARRRAIVKLARQVARAPAHRFNRSPDSLPPDSIQTWRACRGPLGSGSVVGYSEGANLWLGGTMKTWSLLLTGIAAVSLGGCIIEAGGGVPPPPTGGPVPNTAPVARIEPGAGTIVQPGVQAGYGITANVGSSFRIIWTGDAAASASY